MDGERLLRCCVEEVEVGGVRAIALTRGAEVAVAAAHAVYREHAVLLIDCLVAWSWLSGEAWGVAVEHRVEGALEALLGHAVLGALARKVVRDPLLRGTLPNALRYLTRGDLGRRVLARLTRGSY